MTTVLETRGLTRRFGQLVAVDDVDLEIDSEEIASIIGPNGAGKTTFYNLVTGTLEPSEGEVYLGGRDGELAEITGLPPYEINEKGLSRAYQITSIFEGLSVLDNLRAAVISATGRGFELRTRVAEDEEIYERAWEVIELTNLEEVAETEAENLSHGDMRKVDIAIALATDPSVVLLDEPTAGMNPQETDRMVDLIENLEANTETTFVLTEHDMDVVRGISDRIIVFHEGRKIADGDAEDVMRDEQVAEAYLGSENL